MSRCVGRAGARHLFVEKNLEVTEKQGVSSGEAIRSIAPSPAADDAAHFQTESGDIDQLGDAHF